MRIAITIPSDVGSYDVGSIDLIQRSMVSVRGSISDASGNPIWADVLFVNPDDLEEEFWPMWDEAAENLEDGEFAFSIPEGDYLVLARDSMVCTYLSSTMLIPMERRIF